MGVFRDLHSCYIPTICHLHVALVLRLFVFHLFALMPLTPLHNLFSLIFSSVACGWLYSVRLTPCF
jgi:hypothetical protein